MNTDSQNDGRWGHDRIPHALTVDVEEWFQVSNYAGVIDRHDWDSYPSRVEASTHVLLDLFDEHQVSATFFVLGWVADRHPGLVSNIHRRGHELAVHGYSHRSLRQLSPDTFADELERASRALGDLVGDLPVGFRAPDFSLDRSTAWALDCLVEAGIEYDSSIFPVRHSRYGVSDFPRHAVLLAAPGGGLLTELPLTTLKVGKHNIGAAGGAYLRLLPEMITTKAFSAMEKLGRSGCLYMHPWEVDPGQPRVGAGALTTYRHLHNSDQMASRVGRVLSRFRFTSVSECLRINPPSSRIVDLAEPLSHS